MTSHHVNSSMQLQIQRTLGQVWNQNLLLLPVTVFQKRYISRNCLPDYLRGNCSWGEDLFSLSLVSTSSPSTINYDWSVPANQERDMHFWKSPGSTGRYQQSESKTPRYRRLWKKGHLFLYFFCTKTNSMIVDTRLIDLCRSDLILQESDIIINILKILGCNFEIILQKRNRLIIGIFHHHIRLEIINTIDDLHPTKVKPFRSS
jgi:hypothetical protein